MKGKFSERLRLPADLTRGELIMSFTGGHEVFIENYKGIVEYTDHKVLIAGRHSEVLLEGKDLTITYYTDDEMSIEGMFEHIKFLP